MLVVAEPLDGRRSMPWPLTPPRTTARRWSSSRSEGAEAPRGMPEEATLLEMPAEDGGAFAELVGRYAALLDTGRGAADAWHDALDETGWEPAEA